MQYLRKTLASAFMATALLGGTLAAPAVAGSGATSATTVVNPSGHGGDHGDKDKKCHHHKGKKHWHDGYWHKHHHNGKKHWHDGYWHKHKDYKHCHKNGDHHHDHDHDHDHKHDHH